MANTAAQEAYISSLNTHGALNNNSGFTREFGRGETEDQYAARLEAWKASQPGEWDGDQGTGGWGSSGGDGDGDGDGGGGDGDGGGGDGDGLPGQNGTPPATPQVSAATASANAAWSQQKEPYGSMLAGMYTSQNAQSAQNEGRNTQLYNTLMSRANQSLNINRSDPIIRAQADAYSANENRTMRDYISDTAERSGPYANMRGEQRMAAEGVGQRTGAFEAQLMGRELTARRAEVAEALQGMQGMLSADQIRQLQQQLGLIDQAIRQQGLGMQGQGLDSSWQLGLRGQDVDIMRAIMNNKQFLADLGLRAEQQYNMWNDPASPYLRP